MSKNDMPTAHEDLYTEIMQGASKTGTFTIETEEDHPDVEFDVEAPDKPTRNKLRRAMPGGLLDGIEIPDDVDDIEDLDMDDMDLSNISITDMTFDEQSTEVWLNEIASHFSHEYFSETEIRNMFNRLGDEYYISAGSYLIEFGDSTGPVTGFRRGN